MPFFDRIVHNFVGAVIKRLAIRGLNRGDRHLYNHLLAALIVGSPDHAADSESCCLPPASLNHHTDDIHVVAMPKQSV